MGQLCARAGDGKDLSVGQVLRTFLSSVQDALSLGARPRRVLRLLSTCGTFELGAHLFACEDCGQRHCGPRSCGDRHCPSCLAAKSRQWLQAQRACLLPVTYYHGVFTLPPSLHRLVQFNPTRLYPLFFQAASEALLEFGRNRLGGDLGITALLHTWGQQMNFHPHLHCIVTGGALNAQGTRWRSPTQRKFLFPLVPLAVVFRGKFLSGFKKLLKQPKALTLPDASWKQSRQRARLISSLYAQPWHIYVKRPFGGPDQVLAYLANYTHRVAISNRRLQAIDESRATVTFTWRDYRRGSKVQPLTLTAQQFIGRFSWHILPQGLVRIRHYGILANNRRSRDIRRARPLLEKQADRRQANTAARATATTSSAPTPKASARRCPHCGSDKVRWIGFIDAGGRTHLLRPVPLDSS